MAKRSEAKKTNLLGDPLWLLVILLVNLAIVLYPTIATSLPITQTDGLTYFGISQTLAETGDFFAEIPDYLPVKGEEGVYVNEFLPVPILYMAAFIKIFGERIVMNGGALGLLFVLANLYLYLLVTRLTSKKVALIVTLFSVLNFRFYFLLWGGNWANVCGMMFGMPSLYYYLKFLEEKKITFIILSSLFLLLTAGSHTMHFLFVVFLMIGLWFGIKVLKNTEIKLPEIKFKFGPSDKKTLSTVIKTLVISAIVFLGTFIPFVLTGTRTKWVTEWIEYLKEFDKVPQFWHYGILADGPILLVFAVFGVIYAFYKQNWKLLSLAIPSYIIINLTNFLVPDEIWLSLFIYRFQAIHFIILALLTTYFIFSVIKSHPQLKKTLTTLVVLSLVWQATKMGALMSEIEPAITEDEKIAAEYMAELNGEFWLINNVDTFSSFRSYEWIFAYADGNVDNVTSTITERAQPYEYLMIQDIYTLGTEPIGREKVFQQGSVAIYK